MERLGRLSLLAALVVAYDQGYGIHTLIRPALGRWSYERGTFRRASRRGGAVRDRCRAIIYRRAARAGPTPFLSDATQSEGTWDLFRYPGIRSDSDMYTLGYSFRPWSEPQAIADGPAILRYVNETAAEYGITSHIRFGHHVKRTSWSTAEARWTVETERTDTGEPCRFTCNFLFMCSGYYNYDRGYTPEFAGAEHVPRTNRPSAAVGPMISQYADKRVVVIGSGATAVTLVPEMAKTTAHVTMLQRSPTYIVAMPSEDHVANLLRRFLPNSLVYSLTRWRNVILGACFFWFCRRHPERARAFLLGRVRAALGPDYDVEQHFRPHYNPWQQRLWSGTRQRFLCRDQDRSGFGRHRPHRQLH